MTFKVKSLVFIFATTAWTSFSLLPYRIFNICRIHLFDWNAFDCEQREIMNWLAWMLLYLLTVNPVIVLLFEAGKNFLDSQSLNNSHYLCAV